MCYIEYISKANHERHKTVKDHNDYLPTTIEEIEYSIEQLKEKGDADAVMNYLYFLRDEVNALIKKAK